ncbi:YqgE/AlgH family protein [Sandaracinobacter sp. RS1-74]|uniref:YqgE/AlgH family protein n=1 Tax=Sandaracinobacteroides sayramensis TaxID=2913411 RepID=UPI001EDB0829|nr:YqgE/AlgH family protein [Sandaracinobacteroides sayramensis]MCG2842148.1 YqgE/AlgH family protein [Sandaracinobacteroides sayramensis]
MKQVPYLSGQFLLAMPGIGDARFDRSVIAMCAHDEEGALGICLHEPLDDLDVPALMRQLDIDPASTPARPVLAGGPVEPGRGLVLHSPDWSGQDTRHVAGADGAAWALTGTRDVLVAIAAGAGPRFWTVALGYAGWSGGQLERELRRHGWFHTPGRESLLWTTEPELRWSQAFAGAGINSALLAADAGHA